MKKGQSLFEVLLALFIITLVLVSIVILATNSILNSSFSRNKTIAGRYSQQAIEWLRSEKETDFVAFKVNVSSGTYCLNNLNSGWSNLGNCAANEKITNTIFLRQVNFQTTVIDTNKTLITATVFTSWTDSKGLHESRVVTNFTDNREQ